VKGIKSNSIKSAKKSIAIPVIPGINYYYSRGWIDFARIIADARADALDVNVFFIPNYRKK
jgi:dihydroorotate dehydrogenase (fumarate)